jgi:hypothetical protein
VSETEQARGRIVGSLWTALWTGLGRSGENFTLIDPAGSGQRADVLVDKLTFALGASCGRDVHSGLPRIRSVDVFGSGNKKPGACARC